MDVDALWRFLPIGYTITVIIETAVLLIGLSARHPLRTRLFAGLWLTACTYPIVVLVMPTMFDMSVHRGWYLLVAETFAPVAECVVFTIAFGNQEPRSRSAWYRDMIAIIVANLASFGIGEWMHMVDAWRWFGLT